MAVATSYNTVGNREDLTDIVEMVEPETTPMYTRLPKTKAPQALHHEWQVDTRKSPTIKGVIDGTDLTEFRNQAEDRARVGNRIQEFRESYRVTRLQEMVETAGVSSEFGRSKAKATVDIKIDIESAIGSDNDLVVGSGTVANQFRALGVWTDSSLSALPEYARIPSASLGTTSTLDESAFDAVLQSAYEQSGTTQGFDLYCGTTLKKEVSDFTKWQADLASHTAVRQFTQDGTSRTLVRGIDTYRGDWGVVNLIPDLFLARTDGGTYGTAQKQRGYLIPPNTVSIAFMQKPTAEEFDDMGGGRRGMISSILTLCVKSAASLGKFSG